MLAHRDRVGYFAYEAGGRLLDFGCGAGQYVARMAAAGWQAEGLDLSAEAVRICRAAGLAVRQGTLPGADLPEHSYDLVTMWHAIELVPSPRATLEAARNLVRPGGRLAIDCPRFDSRSARRFGSLWYGLDLPRHLTHFTRSTLARHLEACGFEVERFVSVRRPVFIRHSLLRRAEATGRARHRLAAAWRLLPRLMSHFDYLADSTDEMLCIARPARA
jgi:SAM-dependent methyltransferase